MFNVLPYFWLAFMAAVILLPTLSGLMNRPKRPPKSAATVEEVNDGLPPEPSLDFGDELAQMDK